ISPIVATPMARRCHQAPSFISTLRSPLVQNMDIVTVSRTKLSDANFSVKEVVAMVEEVRRVVMGEAAGTGSEFTRVETVDPMKIGNGRVWHVWGWDELPTLPCGPSGRYAPRSWSPPADGMRLSATRFAADN